jgi:chromosomal replication initiation ATPase DnaA
MRPTVEQCFALVARANGITVDELLARNKRQNVIRRRQTAMLLAREFGHSLMDVAEYSGFDNTTVLCAERRAREYREAVLRDMGVTV